MVKIKNNKFFFIFVFLGSILLSNFSFANVEKAKRILSKQDVKIYKEIFEIQKLPIKNKRSKEWKKVDYLIETKK